MFVTPPMQAVVTCIAKANLVMFGGSVRMGLPQRLGAFWSAASSTAKGEGRSAKG
jgi:hypothetical protein